MCITQDLVCEKDKVGVYQKYAKTFEKVNLTLTISWNVEDYVFIAVKYSSNIL